MIYKTKLIRHKILNATTAQQKVNLKVNAPARPALPAQNPPVKIPAPQTAITPTRNTNSSPTTEGGNPLPTNTPHTRAYLALQSKIKNY